MRSLLSWLEIQKAVTIMDDSAIWQTKSTSIHEHEKIWAHSLLETPTRQFMKSVNDEVVEPGQHYCGLGSRWLLQHSVGYYRYLVKNVVV